MGISSVEKGRRVSRRSGQCLGSETRRLWRSFCGQNRCHFATVAVAQGWRRWFVEYAGGCTVVAADSLCSGVDFHRAALFDVADPYAS
jgi:hypothetical protein